MQAPDSTPAFRWSWAEGTHFRNGVESRINGTLIQSVEQNLPEAETQISLVDFQRFLF